MDRKRTITYSLVAGALVLAAWAASAMPRGAKPKTLTTTDTDTADHKPPVLTTLPKARPKIEVVFALDTTGSMSGLLDGAKRKIWSIASFIAQGQPKPELRVGLVAYRDKGDAYVTRFYDLTDDLDTVFEHLRSFEAGGGGDTPEHVSKALYDAVYRASWSKEQSTLKQVYLVGDAPPHTDYADGFDYRKIAKHANDIGIHINTIRCGTDPATQLVWNEISTSAGGEYASIDQSGGMIAIATPYDDKLAALNAKLVDTSIGYGRYKAEVARKAKMAGALDGLMGASAASDRAVFSAATGTAVSGDGDLVNDWKSGKAPRPSEVLAADLPPAMAAMPVEKRDAYVAQKAAERESINKEISELAKKRNEFMKDKNARDAFDSRVEGTITRQAKSIGVRY
jgi:Mg-chelatase subunit ChlD